MTGDKTMPHTPIYRINAEEDTSVEVDESGSLVWQNIARLDDGKTRIIALWRKGDDEEYEFGEYVLAAVNAFEPMRQALREALQIIDAAWSERGPMFVVTEAERDVVAGINAALSLADGTNQGETK